MGDIVCKCKIIREIFNNHNTNNPFMIYACSPVYDENDLNNGKDIKIDDKWGTFPILGNLSFLSVGEEYKLKLSEELNYKNGGYQYKVLDVISDGDFQIDEIDDITNEDEMKILLSITSPKQSEYVHKAYPNFVKLVLKGEYDKIDYHKIYNVAEVRLREYVDKINSMYKYFKIMDKFKIYKLTYDETYQLCKYYTNLETLTYMLDSVPYRVLIDDLGRKFMSTDERLIEVRPDLKDSEQRCSFAIRHFLKLNEELGNTRMDANEMAQYVCAYAPELSKILKNVTIEDDKIYYDEKNKKVSLMSTYMSELTIANNIKERLKNPRMLNDIDIEKYADVGDFGLTNEQKDILKKSTYNDVNMLVGYAGTGKSSSTKALINMLEDNGLTYTLVSPTGRAAKVLSEATGRESTTIHKRIMSGGIINTDFLIIDEASFLSAELTAMLFNQTLDYVKIIFVCDNEQLASIGCGNVIQDIIDSKKVPISTLTNVFRYGKGGISTVATDARKGKLYVNELGKLTSTTDSSKIKDYHFEQIEEEPLEQIIDGYKKILKKYKPKDIIAISPFNVGGFGTYAINNAIQAYINPPNDIKKEIVIKKSDAPNGEICIREGDKVINKKNNYQATSADFIEYQNKIDAVKEELEALNDFDDTDSDKYEELLLKIESLQESAPDFSSVMNGDIGYVLKIENNMAYIKFDEDVIVFNKPQCSNLLLGYAVSFHSVQGSQCKAALIITHPQHKKMLSKNLLYVGLTRAKEYIYEIGDISTIKEALKVSETKNRDTWLGDLLKE